ncbi:NTP transferase domain-containing protein [Actinomadura sp. SCN-SB]|uniref:NTP transferase domain-containing protein n=1 Tax=Actinomadura sp. SCN-SB TaxID=3373092 RepID=UPI00375228EE
MTDRTGGVRAAAGVVLAGGRSTRMGTPKAALEWHSSTLLRRVTGVVARAVHGPVIVVRAPGQDLPALGPRVLVREDPEEGGGPMVGLAVGLAAAAGHADVAFVCSTDLPFLHSAFVTAVLRGFDTAPAPDVVLPVVGGFRQPMAAGYRTALAPRAGKLVDAGRAKPAHLFEEVAVRRLDENALLADARLAGADPALDSVFNVNTPGDYRAARERPAPEVVVVRHGALATGNGAAGPRRVLAATVGAAAERVGLTLDEHVVAVVNGERVHGDAESPLEAGDTVSFIPADLAH